MKKLFPLLLFFTACGNYKKEQLDDLYIKRSAVEKQIDSIQRLKGNVELKLIKRLPGEPLDTAAARQMSRYSADLYILEKALKKIDFSIDSVSKY